MNEFFFFLVYFFFHLSSDLPEIHVWRDKSFRNGFLVEEIIFKISVIMER